MRCMRLEYIFATCWLPKSTYKNWIRIIPLYQALSFGIATLAAHLFHHHHHHHGGLSNLQTVYKHCVCNLDSVHHLMSSNIHFNFNGLNHYICSCSLPMPLNFACCEMLITDAPIIFQISGNINVPNSDPITTSDQPNECSFWVDCRPDTISRALWSRIPQSLESISRASKLALRSSKLILKPWR